MAAPPDLLDELRAVAQAFVADDDALDALLRRLAEDVARAGAEPLPIFPVIHHSPASAAHMVRFLRARQPKLVLIELCEDLTPHLADLADCALPVALQAFSAEVVGHPEAWAPLSVVAPLTPFSAEVQAIAYALSTPGVTLRFVDRPVDMVYQWRDPADDPDAPVADDEDDVEVARLHGGAVGVQVGGFAPTFREFHDVLLQNARMSRFEEWSNLYIEEPTIGASTDSYRETMFLVGALFRRLGSAPAEREAMRRRDRWMWTRIKQALAETQVPPEQAVFLCGAAHIADDDVPEWGTATPTLWDLPARTATRWKYGLIPSSFAAIEAQYGHAPGALSLASSRWDKAVKTWKLQPFSLDGKPSRAPKGAAPSAQLDLAGVLSRPPALTEADADELLKWCAGVVDLARKNRYLASTADGIAIYETSLLLARLRGRLRPTAYDFIDAAETCLEKTKVPGRRNIRALCGRLLGGDRVGQVGYSALPPLVQQVYDQLAPVGIDAKTRRVTRVLLDLDKAPALRPVSRLLWQLRALLPGSRVARPIMGERRLGVTARQESWDVALHGAEQREVIQLAFEGVSVEQVLELRLRQRAFDAQATTVDALAAAEDALVLLDGARLVDALGERAVALLAQEIGADDAAAIFVRVRGLVQYYRQQGGLPAWLQAFVAEGYARYAAMLPEAFQHRHTSPEQLGAMLGFVFTLEGLALAMGCSRAMVVVAIEQAAPLAADPEKLGLLWAAEWMVQRRDDAGVAEAFEAALAHPLGRAAVPALISGFLVSLGFAPRLSGLALRAIGRAFTTLPDRVLLPWVPSLITALRPRQADVLPGLLRDLVAELPRDGAQLAGWSPSWAAPMVAPAPRVAAPVVADDAVGALLRAWPAGVEAWAAAAGLPATWAEVAGDDAVAALLARHPAAAEAWRPAGAE